MFLDNKVKIALAVTVIIIVFGQLGWLGPVQNFFIWITGPVFGAARSVTIFSSNAVSNVFSIGDLQKERAELFQRLTRLEGENALLRANMEEYKQLEQALNLRERTGLSLTAARVVSSDPSSLNQALLLDRGAGSGIVTGQGVVDSSGAYIGRVTRALNNTSELTLISDVNSRIPSQVSESEAKGIIAGRHGLAVALVEVPQGQTLSIGFRVVTSGFTPGVPPGLLIGSIESLKSQPGDLFQEAIIKTSADLRNLGLVFIIAGSK